MLCAQCQKEIPAGSTSCPSCSGSPLDSFSPTLHIDPLEDRASRKRESSRSYSYDSIDNARFVPGNAGGAVSHRRTARQGWHGGSVSRRRFEAGPAGGVEVFAGPSLSDGAALARFHREVRVARQVSHKNVCRVYDIGEVDGRHFLSMEFIKGEELSSLARRIGRLPSDKAIQLLGKFAPGSPRRTTLACCIAI